MSVKSILLSSVRIVALGYAGIASTAYAGDVEGVISNASLERPISGVVVAIEGTGRTATTDEEGRFRINNLAGGNYVLRVVQPGYDIYQVEIVVPEEGVVRVDGAVTLTSLGEDQITVIGARASRLLALERKRSLSVIADVVSADSIGKLPDYNTAEALQRLPGISVETDQGEPRYVIVRGIDPNLNQVTIDGNIVGAPEAEGRRVALDTIPSDLVAAIEVIKAVTPDYDANAVGGSINIVTPTAFDRSAPFTTVTARGGFDGKSERVGFGGSLTHGRRFGPDDTLGIVLAGSYSKRFFDSDNAGPVGWALVGDGQSVPTAMRFFDYKIMRERIGAILNLDWRPNPDTRLYVRNIYNEFTDKEERDQFDFDLGAGSESFPTPASVSFNNGRATREFRQNNQTQKLYNISPGGEFRFGQALLELNYTYARAQERTPIRDDIEFRSSRGKTGTLDLSTSLPTFIDIDESLFDPAAFPLRRIRLRREDIVEDLHAVRADLTIELDQASASFIKLGGKFIDRTKDRDNRQTVQLPVGSTSFADTGTVLPEPPNFFKGLFKFGPTMDYLGVLDFFADNSARLRVDEAATAFNDVTLDYSLNEKIYAGYAMASIELGDLTAIGGLRVEHTAGRYNAFSIRDTDGNGVLEISDVQPLSFDQTYTDVLPSIHLNYQPMPELIIRGAWTNTIGRPNYDAVVPTFEEEDGSGTAGNPDLEPFKSMGLDLSLEYYPDADSIISVAVFYKDIENPIFTRTIRDTSFAGVPLFALSQPQNADEGDLLGIEVNFVKRFTFLPSPLDGLGISANATFVDSSVTVPGREDENIPFFRQSDWIAGGALFYEKGPFEARIAANYRDDYIVAIGPTAASDGYTKDRFVLDARVSYRIFDAVEVFASASNLTKAPRSVFQETERQSLSQEIYGVNADFGISARF